MRRNDAEHEQVPLPPRRVPVPCPGDHDHRLGEERERHSDGDHEARSPPPVEAEVAERRERVERRCPTPASASCQPFSSSVASGASSGGSYASETTPHGPGRTRARPSAAGRSRRSSRRAPRSELDAPTAAAKARREDESDGRRELEAGVLSEQDAGRRERVQPEESRARQARERDEEQPRVTAPPARRAHGPADGDAGGGSGEHGPEVGGMALPDAVRLRPGEQDYEDGGRGCDGRDPDWANHWRVSTSPTWSLQATRCTLAAVNVLLPDGSKLELPDGATGLDAARAIGPRLAEQAVLVRSNGHVQDLRLPLDDGRGDPDPHHPRQGRPGRALRPAPLLGAPARRGRAAPLSGREDRDRPADRERLLLRLRVPGADPRGRTSSGSRRRSGASCRRAARGAARRSPPTRRRRGSRDEPYKIELVDTAEGQISLYTQGDFTDLCRGPHLQDSKPIKALKLTSLAGAYWRGDEHNTAADAHLRHRVLRRRRTSTRTSSESRRRSGATTAGSASSSTSSTSRTRSPGSPFWHPKGMVIWNALEDLRRRENRRRGYVEVKTPLLYDEHTYETSGHLQNYEENIFWVVGHEEQRAPLRAQADELPRATCSCSASRLRSYRELPLRFAESSTLHRDEKGGTLHGLLRVKHITQDDAHVFVAEEQIQDEIAAHGRLRPLPLRPLRARRRAPSSRPARRSGSAPTSSGTAPRARSSRR